MSSAISDGVIYKTLERACLEVDHFIESAKVGPFTIKHRIVAKRRVPPGAGYGRRGIEYEHNELIEFNLSDVGDISGFAWGEILFDLLSRWQESRGWAVGGEGWGYPYINNNWFLWSVWKRFLEFDSQYEAGEVAFEDNASNPLVTKVRRADRTIIGVAVSELIKLADEVFPPRSTQWLELFSSLIIEGTGDEFEYLLAKQISDSFERVRGEVGELVWELFSNLLFTGYGASGYGSFVEVAKATAGAVEV